MEEAIYKLQINKFKNNELMQTEDVLAVEEPLEISIGYILNKELKFQIVAVTMRTPGSDDALALGFLFTENIIQTYSQVERVETKGENKICVFLNKEVTINIKSMERNFYTTSSCGVCGKASIESINTIVTAPVYPVNITVPISIVLGLKNKLNAHQSLFSQTGGIHAAALCTLSGDIQNVYEDVGRHNALDKLIGDTLNKGGNFSQSILLLSGRASFELIQKAAVAGIPIVCAIGAPSSLAVQLANEVDITLIGFLKSETCNIYCGNERIRLNSNTI